MRQGIRATVLAGIGALAFAAPALAAPPPNDDFANATPFTTAPQTLPYTTVDSTVEAGEPHPFADGVWFRYSGNAGDQYRLHTSGSSGDPIVSVFSGPPGATFSDLVSITHDDDGGGYPESDTGFFSVAPGSALYIRVSSFPWSSGPDVGSGNLTLTALIVDPVSCVATTFGTAGPDVFGGTPNPDAYDGLGGADKITGNGSDDCLRGGADGDTMGGGYGADRMNGDNGPDSVEGGYGKDVLSGAAGADTVDGEYDDDYVFGGPGTDILKGGYGNDTVDARDGAGGDTLDCGFGTDVARADFGDTIKGNCETVL